MVRPPRDSSTNRAWCALVAGAAIIGALGCGSKPPATQPAATPKHPELVAAIDALAARALEEPGAAGLAIAVVWHGETIVDRGYGLADAEHAIAADADTVFRVGSISKQLTAAAIVRLADAGTLGLDDELTRQLPSYPARGRGITLRHLLTHTSGIPDYERAPWLREHMAEPRPIAELIATFADEPLEFEPGTRWSYSNSGYLLLSQIIERTTGHSYADEVEAMLRAANVDGVRYCPDEQDYPHAARGYRVDGGARAPARPILMAYASGAGAICATAGGLVAWSRALAGGDVVGDAGYRAMTTPMQLAGGGEQGYGFGLFVGALAGHRHVFHNGGINGFAAKLSSYPDDDLYVAVLVNSEEGNADALDLEIARAVLDLPPPPPPSDLPVDPAEAAAIAGSYRITTVGATIIVELDGGKLYVREEGDAERGLLSRQPDGSYLVTIGNPAVLRFVRDGARVTGVQLEIAGMTFPGDRLP